MERELVSPDALSAVIGTIYDCAVDPQYWPAAIESITRLIDGDHGTSLVFDTTRNQPRFYVDWNADREALRLYEEKYHEGNPLHEHFPRFEMDEPYNITAVMDPAEWMKTRIYQEYGQPRGWLDSVGVWIMKTPSRMASLSIVRRIEVGWAGPRELKIMALLAPHVRRAVSIADLIEMKSLAEVALTDTLDSLAVPIVLVDEKGGIVHANLPARTLLADGDPITSERGMLRAGASTAARALDGAIAQAAQSETRMGKVGIDVPVPFADGRPGFAHVLPIGASAVRGALGPRAAAAVFFSPSSEPQRPPSKAWAAAFGFTPSEMKLLDLLVQGHTVSQAARMLGVADGTVRTHLIRLMAKAGVSRQADLIRLVLQLSPPVRQDRT